MRSLVALALVATTALASAVPMATPALKGKHLPKVGPPDLMMVAREDNDFARNVQQRDQDVAKLVSGKSEKAEHAEQGN